MMGQALRSKGRRRREGNSGGSWMESARQTIDTGGPQTYDLKTHFLLVG